MKAKWVSIVDELRGNVDERHYVRQISGKWGIWGGVCEAGVEQEDEEGKSRAPNGKTLCGTDGGDKSYHA